MNEKEITTSYLNDTIMSNSKLNIGDLNYTNNEIYEACKIVLDYLEELNGGSEK